MPPSLECMTTTSFSNCSFILRTFLLPYILFTTLLLNSPSTTHASVVHRGNETDKQALLAIKAQITGDPLGITSSWNESVHFCSWIGVTCGHLHQRVTYLKLSSLQLVGSLSPYAGNLTFLTGINLELNYFHGQIPPEIGNLFRLRHLNLTNNSFSGEIPPNISQCTNLVLIRLGWNRLTGRIPFQLGSLPKLESIHLHFNNLTGPIPETFGNLSSIKTLSLAANNLQRTIPEALGRLKTLNFLGLGVNQLSGIIPSMIFNLSSLATLSAPFNQLHGKLPSHLGLTLTNLQVLNIGHNLFSGPLPKSLSNASYLVAFDVTGGNFGGEVSIDFGGMSNLWWLILASNPLGTGKEADDLNFLNSLSKCRTLKVLDLSDCHFGGVLPESTANLSTNLLSLRLGGNNLSGSIPPGIQTLVNLTELQLQNNKLTGTIPSVIGNLRMLRLLDLSENRLTGNMPSSLSNITQLYALRLQNNFLTGTIPLSFGNFQYLQELNLSQNLLNGTIPDGVMSLPSLTISLNLAYNQFSGPLPSQVGEMKNLGQLDVSENMLSGEIPSSIGRCVTLKRLQMAGNFFEGPIPSSFSSLRGLQDLDLSRNNLSRQIPGFLQRNSFDHLNLSFNQFDGQVPTEGVFKNASAISVAGNIGLCGGIPELNLPACPKRELRKRKASPGLKLMIPLISGLVGLVIVMSLLIICRLRRTKGRESPQVSSPTKSLLSKVTYEDLFKGTDGFSPSHLIGIGRFGTVYRGILDPEETVVAVKVFHLHQRGAFKSFLAECGALRNIRHRNLVKIFTACSSSDLQRNGFIALVYEFMPNGSLESWLHPSPEEEDMSNDPKILGLFERVNIAIDVASALDYLHNHCPKPIVHCDLKPGNILLDKDMTARVSDFGLAKFIPEFVSKSHPNQSSSIGTRGTVGYAAPGNLVVMNIFCQFEDNHPQNNRPSFYFSWRNQKELFPTILISYPKETFVCFLAEYCMGGKVSSNGDVYSFGILLLEMFTGKRPTDSMFNDGMTLHNFAKIAVPGRIDEILDPLIRPSGQEEGGVTATGNGNVGQTKVDQIRECMISIVSIGTACSVESPRERMDIGDVIKELQLIRDVLLAFEAIYSSTSGSLRFEGSSSRSATSNWQNVL